MKKCLILGVTGQDGSYMAELLLSKKYKVFGLIRKSATGNTKNIEHLINMPGKVEVLKQSYRCPQSVHKIAVDIASRIHHRREKEWNPRDYKGVLKFHAYP